MPSVLVFGSANFYGRALIMRLCAERERAAAAGEEEWEIRAVDKVLPELASFPEYVLKKFKTIDYRLGNMRNKAFLEKVFEGPKYGHWDYVFNFGTELKYGQPAQAYEEDVYNLPMNVAQLSAERNVGTLVVLSTAHMYKAARNTRHKEGDELDPPNALSSYLIKAEKGIKGIQGLSSVILRPALSYGPGDRQNIIPMLIMAKVSKVEGEDMDVIWDKDLPVSTVHVNDVAEAALKTAQWHKGKAGTAVFNLADPGNTTNQSIAKCVGELFGIKVSFQNAAVNFLVKRLKTSELTEEVNESFLGPWMKLLEKYHISNTPLSPYLDQEHPYCTLDRHPLGVDGSLIANTPGLDFDYMHKEILPDSLRQTVDEFKETGIWPRVYS